MNKEKFALIGNGFISPKHIHAIQAVGGEIVGRDCGEKYISILTPNDLHYKMAKAEAKKGKIVLVEKPLAIKSEHVEELAQYPNIFVVLQLRKHPIVKSIEVLEHNEIEMDISVHRDLEYFDGWKGKTDRSGGILFNLGIHYFDMLLHLFGDVRETTTERISDGLACGTISGDRYTCKWRLCLNEIREKQHRTYKINGIDYNFSSKDNLSQEGLHTAVYRDLIQGVGIRPIDVMPVTELIESFYF